MFIKNNRNKGKFIINNKKYSLREFLYIENYNSNKIKIGLILYNHISNKSSMFEECKSLIEFSSHNKTDIDLKENDFSSINDNIMSYEYDYSIIYDKMFYNCINLLHLYDEFQKNYNNIKSMLKIFYNCKSLKKLPDISRWKTNNIITLSHLFYNCSSLSFLPDISKWNTSNVTSLNCLFYNCSSLLSLPDISKWNTVSITDMSNMFHDCSLLKSLPDISKWYTSYVINMSSMFSQCLSLYQLPDISKWDISDVKYLNYEWIIF